MKAARGVRAGFTLVELMVAAALFSALFAVMMSVMQNSDTYYTKGKDKIAVQTEARRIVDTLAMEMRSGSSAWYWNGTWYNLTISGENNTRLDYYIPVFDEANNITTLQRVSYKIDPANSHRLLKRVGIDGVVQTVSESVRAIDFSVGCANCTSFSCTAFANATPDCPVVRYNVTVAASAIDPAAKNITLEGKIFLQNQNSTLGNISDPNDGGEEF